MYFPAKHIAKFQNLLYLYDFFLLKKRQLLSDYIFWCLAKYSKFIMCVFTELLFKYIIPVTNLFKIKILNKKINV